MTSQVLNKLEFTPVPELATDQQFALLAIRNQQIVRESSYSSHIIEQVEHLRWVEKLQSDPSVLFYAVVFEGKIVGGVGLRCIDQQTASAEWSFYVAEAAQGKGIGLALGIGALDLFFGTLKLKQVIGEALLSNPASLSYHQKLGFDKTGVQQHLVQPRNIMADIAVFSLSASRWQACRDELLK
jgi:RimJ/RimL family protein N-acetyltransferase